MGSAYKKNMKNLQGKQDITGIEVLAVGSGLGTDAVSAIALQDANGVSVYTMPRNARLDGLVANVNGASALTGADNIGIELWAGGAVVGSGNLDASNPDVLQILLDKENSNEVKLVAGDTVFANLGVDLALASAQALSVRIHLTLLET